MGRRGPSLFLLFKLQLGLALELRARLCRHANTGLDGAVAVDGRATDRLLLLEVCFVLGGVHVLHGMEGDGRARSVSLGVGQMPRVRGYASGSTFLSPTSLASKCASLFTMTCVLHVHFFWSFPRASRQVSLHLFLVSIQWFRCFSSHPFLCHLVFVRRLVGAGSAPVWSTCPFLCMWFQLESIHVASFPSLCLSLPVPHQHRRGDPIPQRHPRGCDPCTDHPRVAKRTNQDHLSYPRRDMSQTCLRWWYPWWWQWRRLCYVQGGSRRTVPSFPRDGGHRMHLHVRGTPGRFHGRADMEGREGQRGTQTFGKWACDTE